MYVGIEFQNCELEMGFEELIGSHLEMIGNDGELITIPILSFDLFVGSNNIMPDKPFIIIGPNVSYTGVFVCSEEWFKEMFEDLNDNH